MRTKRFLSIVLTLAMLVGMFPSMSLTAYAEGNTKTITPGTDDAKTGTGTMTITLKIKDAQTITASDVTATYGDTDKSVSGTTTGDGAISYSVKSGDAVTVDENTGALTIVKAGSAVITVTAAETATYAQATKEVAVTINKAAPTVTAPTAKTLTYNGQKQELVNAGSTNDGKLYYAVTTENKAPTEESLYTTSIPTATNAGTYYVWYKVVGDANHTDSEEKYITVNIGKGAQDKPDVTKLSVTNPGTLKSADGQVKSDTLPAGSLQYSADGGKNWTDVSAWPLAGLSAGNYCFRYKENDNCKESGASDGIVLEPQNMLTLVTLTGRTVYQSGSGEKLKAKANVEGSRLSYKWYRDGKEIAGETGTAHTLVSADVGTIIKVVVTDSVGGNSVATSIPKEVTVTAPQGYRISGTVQKNDGTGLANAGVALKQGDYVVAETVADNNGDYAFEKIPDGQYNVVVKEDGTGGRVKTAIATVRGSDVTLGTIKMPAKDVSSRLVVEDSDGSGLAGGAVVGKLDDLAESMASSNEGTSTTVTMTVESKEDLTSAADSSLSDEQKAVKKEQSEIKENEAAKSLGKMDFLDLSVIMRSRTGAAPATQSAITDTGDHVLEIVLPYKTTGRQGITVFRKHGTDAAAALTKITGSRPTEGFEDGKFFVGADFIVIYARYFSTYAVGYSEGNEAPGGGSAPSRPSGGRSGGAVLGAAILAHPHREARPHPIRFRYQERAR